MPTIHGVNASPFVRKVRVYLAEKGLDYELNPVMPFGASDDFKKISPLGKIPVYQDGDFTLPDSSCICAYLERKHPTPALYPADDEDYGRALFLEEYADTKLTEVLGTVFVQRVINKKIMKGESDEELCRQSLCESVPPLLDYLESLVEDGEGLVGGRFTIADIGIVSPFVNFAHAGETVDAARWPQLAAYVDRICKRPSFASLIEEEKAGLASI